MKKLPPYGRRLVIPRQTQIVMLYVGNPGCWQAAKRDQFAGQYNHLVLPNVHEANQYLWPVNDCAIVAIDFGNSEPPEIESLITHLAEAGAREVSVRQMNLDQMTVYVRDEQETAA